jgi:hypothetical protein
MRLWASFCILKIPFFTMPCVLCYRLPGLSYNAPDQLNVVTTRCFRLYSSKYLSPRRPFSSTRHTNSFTSTVKCSSENIRTQKFLAWFEERRRSSTICGVERNYAIEYLAQKLTKGILNLNPEYQRGFVWNERRSARSYRT